MKGRLVYTFENKYSYVARPGDVAPPPHLISIEPDRLEYGTVRCIDGVLYYVVEVNRYDNSSYKIQWKPYTA